MEKKIIHSIYIQFLSLYLDIIPFSFVLQKLLFTIFNREKGKNSELSLQNKLYPCQMPGKAALQNNSFEKNFKNNQKNPIYIYYTNVKENQLYPCQMPGKAALQPSLSTQTLQQIYVCSTTRVVG